MGKVYFSYLKFFLFFPVQNDRTWQEMNKNDKIEARKDQIFILNIKNTCLYHNRLGTNSFSWILLIFMKKIEVTMGKVYFSYVRYFLVFTVYNYKTRWEMEKINKNKARKVLFIIQNLEKHCF